MNHRLNITQPLSFYSTCFAVVALLLLLPGCLRHTMGSAPQSVNSSSPPAPAEFVYPPADRSAPLVQTTPLRLSLDDAILMSLENNRSLQVRRFEPLIRETDEMQQAAAFDAQIAAELSAGRQQQPLPGDIDRNRRSDDLQVGLEVSREFETGTRLTLGLSETYANTVESTGRHQLRAGISLTQRLLAGAGSEVVLANLNQARLTTQASRYEFSAYAEAMVAAVIEAYWDYFLARSNTIIYEESLELANRQVLETQDMIRVGRLAESELVAAEAEAALRQQDLIDARSAEVKQRLKLLHLLSPGITLLDDNQVELLEQPLIPQDGLDDLQAHVSLAQLRRPEIHQAELGIRRQELEVVKTRNGLLPRLDFFVGLGKSGYATSFQRTLEDMPEDRYDLRSGLQMDYALGNRRSQARHQRAELEQTQLHVALENLRQLVDLDVRLAYTEALRAREQISASGSLVRLQEEKLRIITEKYRVGRSISFIVAQAQRDLTSARLTAIAARAGYLQALTYLYQMEGTLLERRGLLLP